METETYDINLIQRTQAAQHILHALVELRQLQGMAPGDFRRWEDTPQFRIYAALEAALEAVCVCTGYDVMRMVMAEHAKIAAEAGH